MIPYGSGSPIHTEGIPMSVQPITTIRVRPVTRQRLAALIARLSTDGDGAWRPELRHDHTYISVDEAIAVLLDRDDAHRERALRQRSRKKGVQIPCIEGTSPSVD